MDCVDEIIPSIRKRFEMVKKQGEDSFVQLESFEQINWIPEGETNSVAILVKHLAGNMRSRWTNFLTEDGEKPDRERDSEFDLATKFDKEQLWSLWNQGWGYLWAALDELTSSDLCKTVTIRGKPLSVLDALLRQLAHYANHVGQITLLCRILVGDNWKSPTIPRKK